MALFTLYTGWHGQRHHSLRCNEQIKDGDHEYAVEVLVTRQYGREHEYEFRIGAQNWSLGDWTEVRTDVDIEEQRKAIEMHEGEAEARQWIDAMYERPELIACGAFGDNVAARALRIGNAAIEKFRALIALDILEVGITL